MSAWPALCIYANMQKSPKKTRFNVFCLENKVIQIQIL